MAITGIDTIEGNQIIAAGAVSAKSAEMAYNDENGNPITGYLTAVPEGYATTGDLATVSAKVAPSGIAVFQMYAPSSTYSAVTAAINAGKMVYAKDSDTYLPLTKWNSYYQILYFGSGPGGMGDGHATFTGNATMSIATLCNQHTGGDYSYGWSNSTTAIPNNSLVNNKLDKSAFSTVSSTFYTTANPSGFISEVPAGTMNESAFGYDANDKISGYNGSAFAGGSDVPEGVMVESGLEYNAVNEISGYNGSAIAQYGAEKQWLVHDDTLVHASNSAQYALGVNISAIQQLMGIDETVLFESANAVTNAPLSESMTAFNRVRVSLANDFTDTGLYQTVIDLDVEHGSHVWEPVGGLGITNMWVGVNMLSANTDYTILTAPKAKLINFGNWTAQGTGIVGSTTGANVNVILKVIGIGRKQ